MFKMAKKILAIDAKDPNSPSSSSKRHKDKDKDKDKHKSANQKDHPGGQSTSGTRNDALDDFNKLESDPRIPLNVRQIFKITKSWKAINRTMIKTGTAMFLNLFEVNQNLFHLFERFQHLKGSELQESMELKEHAESVMETLDQSINLLGDYDNFVRYLGSIGELHRKVPGFKKEYFWKIEQPFMKAVKQTLDERCNETIEEIYKIAIKLIIETIAEGYGEDAEPGAADSSSDPYGGARGGKKGSGSDPSSGGSSGPKGSAGAPQGSGPTAGGLKGSGGPGGGQLDTIEKCFEQSSTIASGAVSSDSVSISTSAQIETTTITTATNRPTCSPSFGRSCGPKTMGPEVDCDRCDSDCDCQRTGNRRQACLYNDYANGMSKSSSDSQLCSQVRWCSSTMQILIHDKCLTVGKTGFARTNRSKAGTKCKPKNRISTSTLTGSQKQQQAKKLQAKGKQAKAEPQEPKQGSRSCVCVSSSRIVEDVESELEHGNQDKYQDKHDKTSRVVHSELVSARLTSHRLDLARLEPTLESLRHILASVARQSPAQPNRKPPKQYEPTQRHFESGSESEFLGHLNLNVAQTGASATQTGPSGGQIVVGGAQFHRVSISRGRPSRAEAEKEAMCSKQPKLMMVSPCEREEALSISLSASPSSKPSLSSSTSASASLEAEAKAKLELVGPMSTSTSRQTSMATSTWSLAGSKQHESRMGANKCSIVEPNCRPDTNPNSNQNFEAKPNKDSGSDQDVDDDDDELAGSDLRAKSNPSNFKSSSSADFDTNDNNNNNANCIKTTTTTTTGSSSTLGKTDGNTESSSTSICTSSNSNSNFNSNSNCKRANHNEQTRGQPQLIKLAAKTDTDTANLASRLPSVERPNLCLGRSDNHSEARKIGHFRIEIAEKAQKGCVASEDHPQELSTAIDHNHQDKNQDQHQRRAIKINSNTNPNPHPYAYDYQEHKHKSTPNPLLEPNLTTNLDDLGKLLEFLSGARLLAADLYGRQSVAA